jgi:hypothetical protein
MKNWRLWCRKPRLTAVGTLRADHEAPAYMKKMALTSLTICGRSVGVVRWQTKVRGVFKVQNSNFRSQTNNVADVFHDISLALFADTELVVQNILLPQIVNHCNGFQTS